MSAVDFEEWVAPTLDITLGGRTYQVRPPTVEAAKKIIAAAVRGEVELGIVTGEVPVEVRRVLETIEPDEHPALGDVYAQMQADGVPKISIDRASYYAVFYWARSKPYADMLATLLWAPRKPTDLAAGGGDAPKARRRSPRRSGRSTA